MKERNKIDVLSLVSKETLEAIKKSEELAGEDAFSTDVTYEEMRQNYIDERKWWNEGGPEMFKTVDDSFEIDERNVKVRYYYPDEKEIYPVIFFVHGGGMVVGNLDTHDRMMRILADESGACVIGIDYTLAPDAKYPVQLLEVVHIVRWIKENGKDLQLDTENIGFAGDSGGANLIFGTNLYMRDKGDNVDNVKALLLFYGAFGLTDSPSLRRMGGSWDGLLMSDLNNYRDLYIDKEIDLFSDEAMYYNQLNADLKKDVPATFIAAAELDPLIDDSTALYETLKYFGHDTEYKIYNGVIHAYLHHSRIVPEAHETLKDGAEFFKKRIK